jgi:uncharacterized protein
VENPFRIGAHVSGEHFTDRADEVERVRDAIRQPTRLLVFGPRRMGKSSAIGVAADRAREEGALVVRADLSTATNLVDVANRLLHSLSGQRKQAWLAEVARRLAPTVALTFDGQTGMPRVVFGVDQRAAPYEDQRRALERVIEALADEAGPEKPVAVVLDEFQAVTRLGGEEAEWHLRDLIQRYGAVSFVCAGSEVSLIEEMIGRERAFYRTFELLHLGAIDPDHLARWIESRLASAGVSAAGVGRAVVERAGPRTQDILQVARHLYARGASTGRVGPDQIEGAIHDVVSEESPIIAAWWRNLTSNQQNVLRAVASGAQELFSSATRQRFGLPASSTVATAVESLTARGLLTRDSPKGTITFDSPFVERWVREHVLPDVPPSP